LHLRCELPDKRDVWKQRVLQRADVRDNGRDVVLLHPPSGEVAGCRAQSGDDLAHIDGARDGSRLLGPGQELGMGGLGRLSPGDLVGRLQGFEASRECGGRRMHGEMRPIDPAQFLGRSLCAAQQHPDRRTSGVERHQSTANHDHAATDLDVQATSLRTQVDNFIARVRAA
jgi:hypothetical protein